MTLYLTEFPDFDQDDATKAAVAFLLANGFEDISWGNDGCPTFECDVFVARIDYADPSKRKDEECEALGRFTMECEGELMLETDNWADMLAFINDGKRDFPEYVRGFDALVAEFAAYAKEQGLPEGDATELLMFPDLTADQRAWVEDFITRWDAAEERDPEHKTWTTAPAHPDAA